MKGKSLSRVRLLATPWTAAYQAPPSMGLSRQILEWGAIAFSRRLTKITYITGQPISDSSSVLKNIHCWPEVVFASGGEFPFTETLKMVKEKGFWTRIKSLTLPPKSHETLYKFPYFEDEE